MNAPTDWPTTLALIAATVCAMFSTGLSLLSLRREVPWAAAWLRASATGLTLGLSVLLIYRALSVNTSWAPLHSHVDGLALLITLLAAAHAYLKWTNRLAGVGLFAWPALAVLSLWAVCASWWTFRLFEIGSVWDTAHLLCVFVGMLSAVIAASAGALWLYVDRQMRARDHRADRLARLGRLGNLESIEGAIVRQATVSFVLLTLALLTGGVKVLGGPHHLGAAWWVSPKVLLAGVVWVIFALVMHVRFVPTFRGRRAAILSIVGFFLLLTVLGIAQALPKNHVTPEEPAAHDVKAVLQEGHP